MSEIELTQGKVALVDDEDFEWLSEYKWCLGIDKNTCYARRSQFQKDKSPLTIRMHREILGLHKGSRGHVDHIDGNGLNNQRSNLRVCTNQQNCWNRSPRKNTTSKYKGVSWQSRSKMWKATITCKHKAHFLGYYKNEEDAARAYDKIAIRLFGEFAKTNEVA